MKEEGKEGHGGRDSERQSQRENKDEKRKSKRKKERKVGINKLGFREEEKTGES